MTKDLNIEIYSAEKIKFLKVWCEYINNMQDKNYENITLLSFMQILNYALSDENIKEINDLEEEFLNAIPSIKFSYFINGNRNGDNRIGFTYQLNAYAEKINHILETFPRADFKACAIRSPRGYKGQPGIVDRYSNFRYAFDYIQPGKKIRMSAQFKETLLKHHEKNDVESHEKLDVSKLFLSMLKSLS